MKFEETKRFLNDTMFLLETEIDDLSQWSVYNQDVINEEIASLKETLAKIKEKIA